MAKVLRLHAYKDYGDISGIQLDEVPLVEPKKGEVRIKVEAFSLNYGDFELFANNYMFHLPLPARFGDECAGVIDAVGEGVSSFRIGDRVSTLPWMNDGYGVDGEFAVVPEEFVAYYPENLSSAEACCIWVAYLTAYYALWEVAQIKSTDYVLITAGSSSAGMAAMELCKMIGAKTIGTTRTRKNLGFLKEVGFDHAIAQSDQDMSERILGFTKDKGVRIVYDPIGGGILKEYSGGLSRNSEVFLYGGMSKEDTILPEIELTQKAACLRPFSVYNHIYEKESRELGVAFVYNALKQSFIKPYVEKIYPIDNFQQAFLDQLNSTSRRGKMVISTKDRLQ